MAQQIEPHSSPPVARRLGRLALDEAFGSKTLALRRSFWGGWGGVAMTLLMSGLVVALLVGWVLLWVGRQDGINITLLTLGCIGFALVLLMLFTLQNRLLAYW